jgi:hypothetical protein
MITIVTALYHFLSLGVPFAKKLHSLAKSIGVKRAKNFRQLSFANLAQAVRCKTLLFIGELEAKQRPTLVTRVETAHRLIQGSTLIEIPGAEHDITVPAYLKAVTEAI